MKFKYYLTGTAQNRVTFHVAYISLAHIYPTLWTDSFVVVVLNLVQIAMKTRYFLNQDSQICPHLPPVESH